MAAEMCALPALFRRGLGCVHFRFAECRFPLMVLNFKNSVKFVSRWIVAVLVPLAQTKSLNLL